MALLLSLAPLAAHAIDGHTLTVSGIFLADKYNGGEGVDLFSCQVNKWALAAEKLWRVDP